MLWKIYFIIYTVLIIIGLYNLLLIQYKGSDIRLWIDLLAKIIGLLALYQYSFKKIFITTKQFWKFSYYFVIFVTAIHLIEYGGALMYKPDIIGIIIILFSSLPVIYVLSTFKPSRKNLMA